MAREIPQLSDLGFRDELPARPLKVCVVSSEFLGPVKNGGIATATSALIKLLARDEHRVTLLYTLVENGKPSNVAEQDSSNGRKKSWQYWVEELARQGIKLAHIPHEGDYSAWLNKSWLVKEYLGQHDFDLVYFDDWHGLAYYSVLAKRAGLAPFSAQLHCVITHASKEWVCSINEQHIRSIADLEVCGMERRSVELADVVIGPSRYLLREYERYGWRLPAQTFHQPLPIVDEPVKSGDGKAIPVDELVFFGRLETRKGLWLFCEALDRISDRLRDKTVTFLGRTTDAGISSGLQLLNRSTKWPFRIKLLTDYDRDEAIAYLKQGNKLAVMPSLADNSPCVIHECIEARVPFISTLGSGIQELVHPECWPHVMFEPTAPALAEMLVRIFDEGARFGRPSIDPMQNINAWSAWHRYVSCHRANLLVPVPIARTDGSVVQKDEEKKIPILVTIDQGHYPVQLLIENLAAHVKRLGNFAEFLVLSGRAGEIQRAIADLFTGTDGPSVKFFDPSSIDEARKLIGESEFAFFLDADVEMAPSFFILALDALARDQSAIVTCVGAVRGNRSEKPEIEQLPTGDIPALSALGRPMGGPVWAASPANLAKDFARLEFYNKRSDALASSLFLGDLLMNRRRMENGAVELLPVVGGISTHGHEPPAVKNVEEIRLTAAALDIPRSLCAGGAPWFAISAYGTRAAEPQRMPGGLFSILPPDHPQSVFEARGESGDFAMLAATLGRAELALQLEASQGGPVERVQELMEIAIDAARRRPVFDLAEILANGNRMEFGRQSFPQKLEQKGPLPEWEGRSSHAGKIGVYVDSRLRITGRKIRAATTLLNGGAGKLYFIDVPLCGSSSLTARFRSGVQSPLLVRAKAIDAFTGEEMSSTFAHLNADQTVALSLPLYEIYGHAVFLFEFSGAAHTQVTAEQILVQ
jgi:glycosyltransferase involved in cell wall biosynthesis